jgi:hypothetical protein
MSDLDIKQTEAAPSGAVSVLRILTIAADMLSLQWKQTDVRFRAY